MWHDFVKLNEFILRLFGLLSFFRISIKYTITKANWIFVNCILITKETKCTNLILLLFCSVFIHISDIRFDLFVLCFEELFVLIIRRFKQAGVLCFYAFDLSFEVLFKFKFSETFYFILPLYFRGFGLNFFRKVKDFVGFLFQECTGFLENRFDFCFSLVIDPTNLVFELRLRSTQLLL